MTRYALRFDTGEVVRTDGEATSFEAFRAQREEVPEPERPASTGTCPLFDLAEAPGSSRERVVEAIRAIARERGVPVHVETDGPSMHVAFYDREREEYDVADNARLAEEVARHLASPPPDRHVEEAAGRLESDLVDRRIETCIGAIAEVVLDLRSLNAERQRAVDAARAACADLGFDVDPLPGGDIEVLRTTWLLLRDLPEAPELAQVLQTLAETLAGTIKRLWLFPDSAAAGRAATVRAACSVDATRSRLE